jgi:hypothetical protein
MSHSINPIGLLSIVYYTANVLREPFFTNALNQLKEAAGDIPVISVSQKPMDFGKNICIGDIGKSYLNIYRQMLIGAKEVKTPFIAFAEDDTLYPAEHFKTFLPKETEFAYDMARWSIYSWTKPALYSIKFRRTNTCLIAPRDLFIEAIEERFVKWPDDSKVNLGFWGEPSRYEKQLGVTVRKGVQFSSQVPVISFSHPDAIGYGIQGKNKAVGEIKAYEIPYWGRAEQVLERFYNGK